MKRIVMLLIVILHLTIVFSELKLIPPSPNASSLGVYGDVNVGKYTGTNVISVPIYTIKTEYIDIPISINYSTGGVKVNQESSWVGLGWSLNAGGVITRSISGSDDFSKNPNPIGYQNSYDFFGVNSDNELDPSQAQNLTPYYWEFANGNQDSEPDVFFFNFCGYTGKFYIKKDGKIMITSKSNMQITYAGDCFVAVDGKGIKYYFSVKEYTTNCIQSMSTPPTCSLAEVPTDIKKQAVVGSWYLDRIESTNGEIIAQFNYKSDVIKSLSKPSMNENIWKLIDANPLYGMYWGDAVSILLYGRMNNIPPRANINGDGTQAPPLILNYSFCRQEIDEIYLSEILFNGGKIKFTTSDRKDIDAIIGKSQKLDKIDVFDTQSNKITSVSFNNSYFNDNDIPWNAPPANTNKLRLQLNSVIFKDDVNNQDKKFLFSYNDISLPEKTSNAIDVWGFL